MFTISDHEIDLVVHHTQTSHFIILLLLLYLYTYNMFRY